MLSKCIFYGDCLDILREHIADETIDLIYLDPPYNTGRDFGMGFIDKWEWNRESIEAMIDMIKGGAPPKLIELLHCLTSVLDRNNLAAYLVMMTIRLVELYKVLKSTGSIYLHCDPKTSHYLRLILDQIFGRKNFRNEIIWCYTGASNSKKDFPKKHDNIYRYSKSKTYLFNKDSIRVEYDEKTKQNYKNGLSGSGTFYDGTIKSSNGILKDGKVPEDWWNIAITARYPIDGTKRTGYPTEKPFPLLKRIIKASSNENDLVLDPFCGCGTTLAVAEKLNRKWIGIDNNLIAIKLSEKRLGI